MIQFEKAFNHILVTLRWDEERFPGHENVCQWLLNRCKQLLSTSKLRKSAYWKMFEMEFKFSKLVKSFVFRCLGASKMVGRLQ